MNPARFLFVAAAFVCASTLPACAPLAEEAPEAPSASTPDDGAVDGAALALQRRCVPPPSCKNFHTLLFRLDACCSEKVACGLDMSPFTLLSEHWDRPEVRAVFPAELTLTNTCLRPGSMFVPVDGPTEERVQLEDGADILLTPECKTYNVFNLPMPGCCLPSGACGMSSHYSVGNVTSVLAPTAGINRPQCLTGAEFNRQVQGTVLQVIADAPEIAGRCDYAALDARLPRFSDFASSVR